MHFDSDEDYPNALIYPDRYYEEKEDGYIEDDGANHSGFGKNAYSYHQNGIQMSQFPGGKSSQDGSALNSQQSHNRMAFDNSKNNDVK